MDSGILLSLCLTTFFYPLFLFIGGMLRIPPGLRFKVTFLTLLLTWCVLSWLYFSPRVCFEGILIIVGMSLFAFMFWSVLCWGYTLSMLLCLHDRHTFNDVSEWEKAYAGPNGIQALSINRTQVLTHLNFATVHDNHLSLTRTGRLAAEVFKKISHFFGISQ